VYADEDFLDYVFGEGAVAGEHASETKHGRQPGVRELLECHRASIIGGLRIRDATCGAICCAAGLRRGEFLRGGES
jgi:hypothetical protein